MYKKLLKEAQFCGSKRLLEKNDRRVWWPIMLLVLMCAATVVVKMVNRFLENPTFILQFENFPERVPFPMVLICPELAYPAHRINMFVENIKLPPHLNKTYLRGVVQQLAAFYSPDVAYTIKDLTNVERVLRLNNTDIRTASEALTANCEDTLIRCRLFGVTVNCSDIFTLELTVTGYCCSFNGLTLNNQLHPDQPNKIKKIRTLRSGVTLNYELLVAVNQSQPQSNIDLSYKWVAVEGGGSYAIAANNGTPLSRGTEQWIAYWTRGYRIGDQARFLNEEMRRCRISHEKLTYFPVYHDVKYCLLECEAARTLARCGCVRVTHPRPPHTRLCTALDMRCVKHALVAISTFTNECGCPSTCDVDRCMTTVQNIDLNSQATPFDNFYKGLHLQNITTVRVYYSKPLMKIYARNSYFDLEQLYGQIGGIFNLFFGCSILTLLEISQLLYFFVKERFSTKSQRKKQAFKPAKQNKMKMKLKQIQIKLAKHRQTVEKKKTTSELDMKRKSMVK